MLSSADWLATPEWTARLSPAVPHALSKVRQLYLALYEAITRGELSDGQQLPSSRQLAQQLSLARNTVIAVYAQLQDEGLIVTAGRRGTQVTHKRVPGKVDERGNSSEQIPVLSSRCQSFKLDRKGYAALAPGMPDPELFPAPEWRKALLAASRLPADALGYKGMPLPQLQLALARYLAIYRSLNVEPEQIIITSGTRQSLLLASTVYADQGDRAWVESPGYIGAVEAFRTQGLTLHALPVDSGGVVPDSLRTFSRPALIYLTPCFQYPTGAPLDASRRAQILEFAERNNCVIFEDDYDSEFRDDSQARPALASQQAADSFRVLHAGTFSKLIFPAARIAWLVVPKPHVNHCHQALRALGGGHNTVAQATVAQIVDSGALARHLSRARGIYAQRRQQLLAALADTGLFKPLTDTGGSLSMVATLKHTLPAVSLAQHMSDQQLGAQFLEDLVWDKPGASDVSALVLGLGNVSTIRIPETVNRLKTVLIKCARE